MNSSRVRFLMVGGFLGAGKTTTIGRLAAHYRQQGLQVGIVTNDQAAGLVDTELLRAQGHHVGEVAGACFCCHFSALTDVIQGLDADRHPDLILAEPVGSCTDLVATVAQPLKHLYGDRFDVGPYAVILKPSHGRKILSGVGRGGFSPKAEYIFRKQLEEADLLLLNRIDELSPAEADELEQLLVDQVPGRPVVRMSARTGAGFDLLCRSLELPGNYCRRILELDYDTYAEGEAELGWLNANVQLRSANRLDLDKLLLDLTHNLACSLQATDAEVAHLKTIGVAGGQHSVVNLVSSDTTPVLSLASEAQTDEVDLIINARIATAPEALSEQLMTSLDQVAERLGASVRVEAMQSFRPGRPVPEHRFQTDGVPGLE